MELKVDLTNIDFSDLHYTQVGIWPLPVRIGILLILFIITIGVGFALVINNLLAEVESKNNELTGLKSMYPQKYTESLKLEPLKNDLLSLAKAVEIMIKQLPVEDNVSQLLQEVSQGIKAAKLKEKQIKVGDVATKELYYAIPISMQLSGKYHDLGGFISILAQTLRIITIHDFSIQAESNQDGILNIELKTQTYRYNSEGKNKQ